MFDGNTEKYFTGDINLNSSDFSVSLWMNPDNSNQFRAGIFCINTYNDGLLFRYGGAEDQLYVFGSYAPDFWGSTTTDIPANSWNHIVINGSNGVCTAYVNGVSKNTFSYDSGQTFGDSPYITIGAPSHALYEEHFNGQIDAVGIWNRALSDGEVAELYNNGTGLELDGVPQPTLVKLQAPVKFMGKVKFGV